MNTLTKYAWIAVVTIALILSNWSLAVVSHHWGLPYLVPLPLAWLVSIPYDAAAIIAGNLALQYARELGSNGAGAKLIVLTLAGISAYLNSQHASILHLGIPAKVMYASPPVIAVILFELNTRFEYRRALAEAGRTVEPLPTFGTASWVLHCAGAVGAVWRITGKRLESRTARAIDDLEYDGTAGSGETKPCACGNCDGTLPADSRNSYKRGHKPKTDGQTSITDEDITEMFEPMSANGSHPKSSW